MTFRTILGISKKLVCWHEENNQLSLVSTKKILSPQLEELVPGAFCKVKQFQKCLCRVEDVGTEAEMTTKLEEMEMQEELKRREEEGDTQPPPKRQHEEQQEEEDDQEAQPPPKKRSRKGEKDSCS